MIYKRCTMGSIFFTREYNRRVHRGVKRPPHSKHVLHAVWLCLSLDGCAVSSGRSCHRATALSLSQAQCCRSVAGPFGSKNFHREHNSLRFFSSLLYQTDVSPPNILKNVYVREVLQLKSLQRREANNGLLMRTTCPAALCNYEESNNFAGLSTTNQTQSTTNQT